MKKIALVIFVLFSGSFLFAQTNGRVSGTVKDKNTQEELSGVVLRFLEREAVNTVSDEYSSFIIQLPVGKYNLGAVFIGFLPYTSYN